MANASLLRRRALGNQRMGRAQIRSVEAPTGGVNTRDSQADMPATDALSMVNWYPDVGKVRLRNGFASAYIGIGSGDVLTLAEYQAGATRTLIGASASTLYNVVTGAVLATGFSSGRWQTANFKGNMLLVNGADTPQVYDGSTVSASTISGPTVTNLVGCNVYRNRMWVWESNKQVVWYGATATIGGAYSSFSLNEVGNFGGNLIAMATWTHDGGSGADDYAVFIMSSGDTLIYSGDPGSTFALVGVYRIPAPIDVRSVVRLGGDVMLQTRDDYIVLSDALDGINKTSKAVQLIRDAYASYSANTGWQGIYYPRGGMVIFNIPVLNSSNYDQHVVNVKTGAWTTFDGMDARCWGVFNDQLYFGGGDGVVYRADYGDDDNGAYIAADCKQAWTALGVNGPKRVSAFRTQLESSGSLTTTASLGYDFVPTYTDQVNSSTSGGTLWGSAWGSPWSPVVNVNKDWRSGSGRGYQVGIRLRASVKEQYVYWYRTDFMFVAGGQI